MKKQAQTNNKQQDKTATKQTKVEQKKDLIADITTLIDKASEADKNVRMYKVTGYTTVKYANKVLFELHAKKRSISHMTFSSSQAVMSILKENKLILRTVPKSYGWKFDTECLITPEFIKQFPGILKNVVAEAVKERNLKEQPAKKQAKA